MNSTLTSHAQSLDELLFVPFATSIFISIFWICNLFLYDYNFEIVSGQVFVGIVLVTVIKIARSKSIYKYTAVLYKKKQGIRTKWTM